MMWAKRLGAVAVAAGLIVGAVLIRGNVIEGDDDAAPTGARAATTLVCLTELKAICDELGASTQLDVRIASAAATTRAWSEADTEPRELWLTFAPLPEVVEQRRASARREALAPESATIAASALALVVPTAKAAELQAACPGLDWTCVGRQAGKPWPIAGGTTRPAFAPIDTGIGQVGLTAAVRGFFGELSIAAEQPEFISWSRGLHRVANGIQLSGGTAIATIQVRQSALDVAIGAEAELANERRQAFDVLYAAPMARVDLVLAAPAGVEIPSDLVGSLREIAGSAGWEPPTAVRGEPPTASDLLAATAAWEAL